MPNKIFDIETGDDISSWYTMTASSVRINDFEPADGYAKVAESFMIGDAEGSYLTGLHPGQQISLKWDLQMGNAEGSILNYHFKAQDVCLPGLLLETQLPKVISAGNVVVAAVSNLDDAEESVGFEWRRTDWTDDFPSNTGTAYLFDGMMEGYIRNLYTEKLWRYRPYYESADGRRYYGDWVGIDPTNTSFFEPTVHTYAAATVNGNEVTVRGYVMRGTDAVSSQGFVYWPVGSSGSGNAAPSVPQDAVRVEASGTVMQASLTGLSYETDYRFAAYVVTGEGETYYGELQQFRTGQPPSGVVAPESMATVTVVGYYDLNGRRYDTPQPGLNIVKMSDGTARKVLRR